jgi:hypothetical protein
MALVEYHMTTATSTWATAARRALVSGSIASVLSTATLAVFGQLERGAAAGPINGPSQWLWGRWAARKRGASVRHTVLGHVIHHFCSCAWALVHERWVGRDPAATASKRLEKAVAVAALACAVDYRVAPKRLQPGFEKQLSKPALLAVYAAFAVGLAIAARKR